MIDTVIFDLDGTLLNSLEDLCDSANAALLQMGFPQHGIEEIRYFVGNGVAKLMERAVPAGSSEEAAARALALFRAHYSEHMEDKTRPYEGVMPLLTALREDGYKVGVVSNKYDRAVKSLCEKYFPGLIDAAAGEKENVRRKPAPDGVFEALRLLKSDVSHAVYIGDSNVDIETAKNSGTVSIGVLWGFRDEEELREAGADFIVSKPEQIHRVLTEINQTQ